MGSGRDTEMNNIEQLAVDLCRELYDRFVMGGWSPEDAHAETVSRLRGWSELRKTEQISDDLQCPKCGDKFSHKALLVSSVECHRCGTITKWEKVPT